MHWAHLWITLLGTVIDQGEASDLYFQKFPEDNPVLGFFTWRWVLTLGFDHMFSSPVFLGNLVLLGASLMACTYTTQIPLLKVSRRFKLFLLPMPFGLHLEELTVLSAVMFCCRWNFLYSADTIKKQEFSDTLPNASVRDLGVILMGSGYEVFIKGPSLYAFNGLAGRFAPIGVHLALLLVMVGGTISATGSFRGSVTVPQGLNFVTGDVLGPSSFLSTPSDTFNTEVHVNRFYMDFYDSGEVTRCSYRWNIVRKEASLMSYRFYTVSNLFFFHKHYFDLPFWPAWLLHLCFIRCAASVHVPGSRKYGSSYHKKALFNFSM